jgi:hypothetical protein
VLVTGQREREREKERKRLFMQLSLSLTGEQGAYTLFTGLREREIYYF